MSSRGPWGSPGSLKIQKPVPITVVFLTCDSYCWFSCSKLGIKPLSFSAAKLCGLETNYLTLVWLSLLIILRTFFYLRYVTDGFLPLPRPLVVTSINPCEWAWLTIGRSAGNGEVACCRNFVNGKTTRNRARFLGKQGCMLKLNECQVSALRWRHVKMWKNSK